MFFTRGINEVARGEFLFVGYRNDGVLYPQQREWRFEVLKGQILRKKTGV